MEGHIRSLIEGRPVCCLDPDLGMRRPDPACFVYWRKAWSVSRGAVSEGWVCVGRFLRMSAIAVLLENQFRSGVGKAVCVSLSCSEGSGRCRRYEERTIDSHKGRLYIEVCRHRDHAVSHEANE